MCCKQRRGAERAKSEQREGMKSGGGREWEGSRARVPIGFLGI
jgi:hypothetical protein